MLVETFALMESQNRCEGLTLSTSSKYVLLKEILERIWEAIEQLCDSSIFFYKGRTDHKPVLLQRICFTEDALIFRLLSSLFKRLDDLHAGSYDIGFSALSISQGQCAYCLLTERETTLTDYPSYCTNSLSTMKSLIEHAYTVYSNTCTTTTIMLRLCIALPTRIVFVFLVEPAGAFESTHYFDSLAAFSDANQIRPSTTSESLIQWYCKQDYFTQLVISTVPTFCYIDYGAVAPAVSSGSGLESMDPVVQLATGSTCAGEVIDQLVMMSGLQHFALTFPRGRVRMSSPKRILRETIQRRLDDKSSADALMDLHLYNAYVELDISIGSRCASRSASRSGSSSRNPTISLVPWMAPRPASESRRSVDGGPIILPVTAHVVQSTSDSNTFDKARDLSVTAILDVDSSQAPAGTPPKTPGTAHTEFWPQSDTLLCVTPTAEAAAYLPDASSSEYTSTVRSFITTVECIKEVKAETRELRDKIFRLKRHNMQQKLAIVSKMASFLESTLSSEVLAYRSASFSATSAADSRPRSQGCFARPRRSGLTAAANLRTQSNNADYKEVVALESMDFSKTSTPGQIPVASFLAYVKHEIGLYQSLAKVYNDFTKEVSPSRSRRSSDSVYPADAVQQFLSEETARHNKASSVLSKKIATLENALQVSEKLQANHGETQRAAASGEVPQNKASVADIQTLLEDIRTFIASSTKKIVRCTACVQKSFELQNEVKTCLTSSKLIKALTRQIAGKDETANAQRHVPMPRQRSGSPNPSITYANLHGSIKIPLKKLLEKLTGFDDAIADIRDIARRLEDCRSKLTPIKNKARQLSTRIK